MSEITKEDILEFEKMLEESAAERRALGISDEEYEFHQELMRKACEEKETKYDGMLELGRRSRETNRLMKEEDLSFEEANKIAFKGWGRENAKEMHNSLQDRGKKKKED